jgi:hypothetical protein
MSRPHSQSRRLKPEAVTAPRTASAGRSALLAALFCCGIGLARLLWDHITLPPRNPWHVAGSLTLHGYNPANNVVRAYFMVLAPSLVLAAACFACRPLRAAIARSDGEQKPEKAGARPRRLRRAMVLIVLFAVAMMAGVNSPTDIAHGDFDAVHEGESLATAVSCGHGLAPYRDFDIIHGYYQDPGRALAAFALFGRSIGAVRTLGSIVKLATFALMVVAALLLCDFDLLLAFIVLGCYVLPQTWLVTMNGQAVGPVVFTTGRYLSVFVFIVSLLGLHGAVRRQPQRKASILIGGFAVGFVAVGSFAMSVDVGAYLTASAIVLLPALYLAFPFAEGMRMRAALASAVGAAAGMFVTAWSAGFDLPAFVSSALIVGPKTFDLAMGFKYPIGYVQWFGALVLAAVNVYWLTSKLLSERSSRESMRAAMGSFARRYYPELSLGVVALALLRSSLSRCDWVHIAIGLGPMLLLSLAIICRHAVRPRLNTGAVRGIAVAAVIGGVALASYLGVHRMAEYSLIGRDFPLAATDADFIPESHQAAVAFLKANLGPRDSFYVLTSEASWFYYLDRPCPTRYPCVLYAMADFQQQELVDELKAADVKLIIVTNKSWSNNIDGIPMQVRSPIVAGYVRDNYHPLRTVAGQVIWERNQAIRAQ